MHLAKLLARQIESIMHGVFAGELRREAKAGRAFKQQTTLAAPKRPKDDGQRG